ncbi:hypothetical protein Murru_0987 [Allomuricauda ruestringensis DSM 13258]|uniref:Uncharacterized protein n=1 Tax=Allomuricauda ruestringensis (strain DSM 13258 / CIP 107369 / LMG 19739 / B1) TaxID=886377 RepID=G2PLK2_ALLRU|nr:hypothetical protein Murru_0987 [Allomuricauda ruestringensis DSM 13258]
MLTILCCESTKTGCKALKTVVKRCCKVIKWTELLHNELSSSYFVLLKNPKNVHAFVQLGKVEFPS